MAAARVTLADARRDVFMAWREAWAFLVALEDDAEAYHLAESVDRAIKRAFTPK
jgi:hypothetical protein